MPRPKTPTSYSTKLLTFISKLTSHPTTIPTKNPKVAREIRLELYGLRRALAAENLLHLYPAFAQAKISITPEGDILLSPKRKAITLCEEILNNEPLENEPPKQFETIINEWLNGSPSKDPLDNLK